jgi:hypothetical protein
VREVGALWLLENERADELLAQASLACVEADALPELVALAGLYPETSWWEMKDALDATMSAYGFDPLDEHSTLVPALGLREMCRRFLNGQIGPRTLLDSAHDLVGHSGHSTAARLVALSDLFDDPGFETLHDRATIVPDVEEYLLNTEAL